MNVFACLNVAQSEKHIYICIRKRDISSLIGAQPKSLLGGCTLIGFNISLEEINLEKKKQIIKITICQHPTMWLKSVSDNNDEY